MKLFFLKYFFWAATLSIGLCQAEEFPATTQATTEASRLPPSSFLPFQASYESLKKSIFDKKCISCHGAEKRPTSSTPRLDSFEDIVDRKKGWIVPLKPELSLFMKSVAHTDYRQMPPPDSKIDPLSPQEQYTLRQWIQSGAPKSSTSEKPSSAQFDGPEFYRKLIMNIRTEGQLKFAVPGGPALKIAYHLGWKGPKNKSDNRSETKEEPTLLLDLPVPRQPGLFIRNFMDMLRTTADSKIEFGKDIRDLTCVYVDGQDNRFTQKPKASFPDFTLRVWLVAEDPDCEGPWNKDWPSDKNGGHIDTWDTYIYFEIRDPVLMTPEEAYVKFENNIVQVLIDHPDPSDKSK